MRIFALICGIMMALLAEVLGADAGWTFNFGSEYPGATGNVRSEKIVGSKDGFRLTADFSNGGNYVGSEKRFSVPVQIHTLIFKVKTAARRLGLRIVDNSGQTHQQYLLLNGDGSEWQDIEVKQLGGTSEEGFVHWGGTNDGVVKQPIRSIMFIVSNLDVAGEKWVTAVKQIDWQ